MSSRNASDPATAGYLPFLLARIRDADPKSKYVPVLEPAILHSLLLSMIASAPDSARGRCGRHLLIRTRVEDVSFVMNVAASMLSAIFGLHTHKVKLARTTGGPVHGPDQPPEELLRTLFTPQAPALGPAQSASAGAGAGGTTIPGKLGASPRHRPSKLKPGTGLSLHHAPSYPSDDATVAGTVAASTAYSPASPERKWTERKLSAPSLALTADSSSKQPQAAHGARAASSMKDGDGDRRDGGGLGAAKLDMSPTYAERMIHPDLAQGSPPPPDLDGSAVANSAGLPHAVVVSGLEHAGVPAQRALSQTLADGHCSLDGDVLNFPDRFLVVYVCPYDARERPKIHLGLLDRFSIGANIFPNQNFRESAAVHRLDVLPIANYNTAEGEGDPIISGADLGALRALCTSVYLHPNLELYTTDLFSAVRHHSELDGLLTVRAHQDALAVVRAQRLLGGDTLGVDALMTQVTESSVSYEFAGEDEGAEVSIDDKLSFQLDEQGLTRSAQPMDVSAEDVRRMVPRVVAHRLRVRDAPHDQVLGSLFFPAVPPNGSSGNAEDSRQAPRRTVRDILVSILNDRE